MIPSPDWSSLFATAVASFFGAGIGALIGAFVARRNQMDIRREARRAERLRFYDDFMRACRKAEFLIKNPTSERDLNDARRHMWDAFAGMKAVSRTSSVLTLALAYAKAVDHVAYAPPGERQWEHFDSAKLAMERQGSREFG